MLDQHISKGKKTGNEIIVIDSYDGAEHQKTKKGQKSVVSFSSQIIATGTSAANSFNILTWQQMLGDEKPCNIFPSLENVYKEKLELRQNGIRENGIAGSKFCLYDLHDGKMLYMLTQHSLFNQKHYPFLLCKCKRGEGVSNNGSHVCEMISHTEQIRLYKQSKRR